MNRNIWKVVHDADDENSTMWSCEINHKKYGRFCWIIDNGNHFSVEIERGGFVVLAQCKSLISAKRWVAMHL